MSKPVGPRALPVLGRVLDVRPSTGTERDFKFALSNLWRENMDATLARHVMCVQQTQAVRDQGQYGACVGFGITDAILHGLIRQDGRWAEKPLSPMLTWMLAKEQDEWRGNSMAGAEGTSIKAGLDVVRKVGCVYDVFAPMGTVPLYNGQQLAQDAGYVRARGYMSLGMGVQWHRDAVRWLMRGEQVVVGVWCDRQFLANKGEVIGVPETTRLGAHCCRVVGVRDYDPTYPGKAVWKIGNSWGTAWGSDGYGEVSHAWLMAMAFEAYVIEMPSVPFYG